MSEAGARSQESESDVTQTFVSVMRCSEVSKVVRLPFKYLPRLPTLIANSLSLLTPGS